MRMQVSLTSDELQTVRYSLSTRAQSCYENAEKLRGKYADNLSSESMASEFERQAAECEALGKKLGVGA